MAIAGVKSSTRTALVVDSITIFKAGRLDVGKAVSATVALLELLGLVQNEAELRSSLEKDYTRLAALGYDGRLYPELPAWITFEHLLQAAEGKRPSNVDPAYRWASYWTPGTEAGSVTDADLNGSVAAFTARLALFSATPGDYDPVLHFRGQAFDDKYRLAVELTQLESIQQVSDDFATRHAGANLRAADHRDYLVWALMDRLARRKRDFVLNDGYLRVPVLERRTVGGGSIVGDVFSHDGQLYFVGVFGKAFDGGGVGLSAGFEED